MDSKWIFRQAQSQCHGDRTDRDDNHEGDDFESHVLGASDPERLKAGDSVRRYQRPVAADHLKRTCPRLVSIILDRSGKRLARADGTAECACYTETYKLGISIGRGRAAAVLRGVCGWSAIAGPYELGYRLSTGFLPRLDVSSRVVGIVLRRSVRDDGGGHADGVLRMLGGNRGSTSSAPQRIRSGDRSDRIDACAWVCGWGSSPDGSELGRQDGRGEVW